MALKGFLSRYVVTAVMVPIIIGLHYGWYRLQKVDKLVSEQDRKRLPFSSLMFQSWNPVPLPRSEFLNNPMFERQPPRCSQEDFMFYFY